MKYDYVVVGSGLFGCVFAQQAKEQGKKVLIVEQRAHIGGNCYSYDYEDSKINIHKYGTHIFHTNNTKVWKYITRFTKFNRYQHRVLTTHKEKVYSMPINLGTVNSFYGLNMKPAELPAFLESKRGNIKSPKNLEEKAISLIGQDLYEAFIKEYTQKQWGRDPKELPASIITRLPVRVSYNDSYFSDLYQGIPVDGYTPIFERMTDGIPVEYGVDFLADQSHWRSQANNVVYTGPIDRFFNYEYGRLNWRSVRFETEYHGTLDDYQGTSVMNYADMSVGFTRIHEPKHLHLEKAKRHKGTVTVREYSHVDHNAPYYPVNAEQDRNMFKLYEDLKSQEGDVIFGGRLAEYKYYDMHHVIASALTASKKEL